MEINARDFMYQNINSENFEDFEKEFKEKISNNELDFNLYNFDEYQLKELADNVSNQSSKIDYSKYESLC